MGLRDKRERPQSAIDDIKLIRNCPMCQEVYTGTEVHVFESHEGSHFFHMTCLKCQGSLLGIVARSPVGMSSVYSITDLTVLDYLRSQGTAGITEDTLLAFHKYLQEKQRFETAMSA